MADDGDQEPQRDDLPVPGGDDGAHSVPGQRESGQEGQQMQRMGSVPATDPAHKRGHEAPVKLILLTHLVLCTPGALGMIVRAG